MIDRAQLQSLLTELEKRSPEELESEVLEFEPWNPDRPELYRALSRHAVCFANASGGTILLGVQSVFSDTDAITGCSDFDLDELRRAIYQATDPGILVHAHEILFKQKTLLVVEVPKGIPPHGTRDGFSARRTGKTCEAIVPPRPTHDFTAQLLDLGEEAIDPLEVERLRNILAAKETGSGLLRMSNHELLRTLNILKPDVEKLRLTVTGLLLVGKEAMLRQHLPGHEAIFLHLTGESEYDRRVEYRKPLLGLLEELSQQIEPHNRIFTLKLGLFHFEIPDFPPEVYREALLNAFMHRDYASLNPVHVRLSPARMEISSPGGFIGGITSDNIISHEPVTRNRLLAETLQKLRLVERSGIGVRRMYRILLSSGKEPPVYVATPTDVRVLFHNGRTDEAFARFIAKRQKDGQEFSVGELLVISYLKRNQEVDLQEAIRILQRGSYEAHELLGAMVERQLLEPFGQKKGRVYRLSKAVYAELRQSVEYYLHRDAEAAYAEAAITNYIQRNGFITNQMVRTLLRVNRSQSGYILHKLVQSGRLVLTGHARKAQYQLPGK